jgi:hypothetical protein
MKLLIAFVRSLFAGKPATETLEEEQNFYLIH